MNFLLHLLNEILLRLFRRRSESHNARHIFCPGPPVMLLRAAVQEGPDSDSLPDIQETGSLRAVKFMCAGAQHVDVQFIRIQRNLSECLYRVGMEKHAVPPGDFTDFTYRLNGSDLIVGRHDGDQNRIGSDRFLQFTRIHHPVGAHIQPGNLCSPLSLQILTGIQDCGMLDLRRDDVSPLVLICLKRRFQRPVV